LGGKFEVSRAVLIDHCAGVSSICSRADPVINHIVARGSYALCQMVLERVSNPLRGVDLVSRADFES
jgi:hypothetical protein